MMTQVSAPTPTLDQLTTRDRQIIATIVNESDYIMFGKLLTIKLRFESTNENQLTLESNLAVEVKIDSDGIKFPPNH
ncbi:hypothetical protein LC605_13455 [Nostoc sp. CHAB 5836]|uniref:hypothetical protein n=1 Tax=Nostoc sp. CHAB 5836 TaxID=2780404 RepID=UPI001E2CA462|nr:hypothetical protein [Nostoc sp. CHAB 5836]MCC5616059.1 hypothetical protein [Nostoc sp. CHAB 5836]